MSERVCLDCGASLAGRRRGTRFCDATCRSRYWKRGHTRKPARNVSARPRRPSRDGNGTRIYVTAEDFNPDGSPGPSLNRKLDAAFERLLRKEAGR